MSYDVFVVAAVEDRDMAKLVVRRLRGLKMRVWYDARSTDDVFDARESRAIDRSKAMIVLWSEHAVKSDFVRAAAGQGYSKISGGYPFIQAALDPVEPYEPYSRDTRHDLKAFTSRTNTEGWFGIVHRLEAQQGRMNLKEWLLIPTKDRDAQDAWRARHPEDPLAEVGQPVGIRKESDDEEDDDDTGVIGAAALAAGLAAAGARVSEGMPVAEKVETRPAKPAMVAAPAPKPAVDDRIPPITGTGPVKEAVNTGAGAVWWMLAAIAALFLLAYLVRTLQARPSTLPAVSNVVVQSCPAGTMPRNLLDERLLSPGQIVNDTPGN